MSEQRTESRYAKKVRAGNRIYGPTGFGPFSPITEEAIRRRIEDVKYWVARIRARSEDHARAVTLEDIAEAKAA